MPRPQRCRRICEKPGVTEFLPDHAMEQEAVILTLDEYEVIRLVDLERQTHEQAAKQMEISRSTVTEIYDSARKKLADSIVNGRRLVIDGGIIGSVTDLLRGVIKNIVRNSTQTQQ